MMKRSGDWSEFSGKSLNDIWEGRWQEERFASGSRERRNELVSLQVLAGPGASLREAEGSKTRPYTNLPGGRVEDVSLYEPPSINLSACKTLGVWG